MSELSKSSISLQSTPQQLNSLISTAPKSKAPIINHETLKSCSICYEESNNNYICDCGQILCSKCIKTMLENANTNIFEDNLILSILCPKCRKLIYYYEIINLFSITEFIENAKILYLKFLDNKIINVVRTYYPLINKFEQIIYDDICNACPYLDAFLKYHKIVYKIVSDNSELPLPTIPLYKLANINLEKIEQISNHKYVPGKIYIGDLIETMLNYYIIDKNIYYKLRDLYLKRFKKFYSAESYGIWSKINVAIREFKDNTNITSISSNKQSNNIVIAKCKNCRYGLIIDRSNSISELPSNPVDQQPIPLLLTAVKSKEPMETYVPKSEELTQKKYYECNSCHQKYCSKCLVSIPRSNIHSCHPDDVLTWNEIRENSKPCPCCGSRIFRSSGCNQMFCTNCHNNFDYSTGKILAGNIHNEHRAEWIAHGTHYTNTDISEIEKYSSIKFNRLLSYHNILMTNHLNYMVSKNEIFETNDAYEIRRILLAYYNDIETNINPDKRIKFQPFCSNLKLYIEYKLNTYNQIFMKEMLDNINSQIIETIYANLLKIINEPDKYVIEIKNKNGIVRQLNENADKLYDDIINQLLKYDELLFEYEHKYDLRDVLHFLVDILPIKGFENIAYVDLGKMGIERTSDLYDIIDDLIDDDKKYDESKLSKYYSDSYVNTDIIKSYNELARFLRQFHFHRQNIEHSYYLNGYVIEKLL